MIHKLEEAGCKKILLTERGTSFGYHCLVNDMRAIPRMQALGCPVIFDATHSVQLPGGLGGASGGQRQFIAPLTRAAVAAGIDGLFMEIHPDPDRALCDVPNSMPRDQVEDILAGIVRIRTAVEDSFPAEFPHD